MYTYYIYVCYIRYCGSPGADDMHIITKNGSDSNDYHHAPLSEPGDPRKQSQHSQSYTHKHTCIRTCTLTSNNSPLPCPPLPSSLTLSKTYITEPPPPQLYLTRLVERGAIRAYTENHTSDRVRCEAILTLTTHLSHIYHTLITQ